MVSLFFLVQFHSFYLWHIQMRTDKNTHTDRQNTSVFCSCPFVLVWCFVCLCPSVFVCPSPSVFCPSVSVRVCLSESVRYDCNLSDHDLLLLCRHKKRTGDP
uniref:Uncharacterized protein n=1 Tax=Meloidogyne enterolobii TaxID=390850 RepID=A0A6V7WDY0_MELEN|nr:unnamed protein product [Meloidogyne enterolobii]